MISFKARRPEQHLTAPKKYIYDRDHPGLQLIREQPDHSAVVSVCNYYVRYVPVALIVLQMLLPYLLEFPSLLFQSRPALLMNPGNCNTSDLSVIMNRG